MGKIIRCAIINKTIDVDKTMKKSIAEGNEVDDNALEELDEEIYQQTRTYKGLCTNQYVDEELDDIIQSIIHAKAWVFLKRKEDASDELFESDAETIIKGYPDKNFYEVGEKFITFKTNYWTDENGDETTDGSGFYDFDEGALYEYLKEDYRENWEGVLKLSDHEMDKLYKILIKFFNDCDPRKYHYNEEFDILTIRDPKPHKKGKVPLPDRFIQLIISLSITVASIVVGLAVLPNVVPNGGLAIGIGVIALGLAIASIVLRPTPAVGFLKICLLGIKVYRGLDEWQKDHMGNFGAGVLIIFPLYFIFTILAFVVTLAIGLVVGILMFIVVAIIFLIPYQIMGWTNRL